MEWLAPGNEVTPQPPPGYVVSFLAFHSRGFGMPAHPFLRGLLFHYGVRLHNLTPNRILQMAAFVALYEGFLGMEPHFDLWTYFFRASLERAQSPIGCASIRLKQDRAGAYMLLKTTTSNKGWHDGWFFKVGTTGGST